MVIKIYKQGLNTSQGREREKARKGKQGVDQTQTDWEIKEKDRINRDGKKERSEDEQREEERQTVREWRRLSRVCLVQRGQETLRYRLYVSKIDLHRENQTQSKKETQTTLRKGLWLLLIVYIRNDVARLCCTTKRKELDKLSQLHDVGCQ